MSCALPICPPPVACRFRLLLLATVFTFAASCQSDAPTSDVGISPNHAATDTSVPVSAPAAPISTASEVVDALAAMGFACGTLTQQQVQPPELESITCDGVRHLDIFTFAGAAEIETWRRDVIGLLCASGILGAELPIVVSDRWAVATEDAGAADAIAAHLGAAAVHAGDVCAVP